MDNAANLVLLDGEFQPEHTEMLQLRLGLEGFQRMPDELICRMTGDVIEPGYMYKVNAHRLLANAPEFLVHNRLVTVVAKSPDSRVTIRYASRVSYNQFMTSFNIAMYHPPMVRHNFYPLYDTSYEMEGTFAEMFLQERSSRLGLGSGSQHRAHIVSVFFQGEITNL